MSTKKIRSAEEVVRLRKEKALPQLFDIVRLAGAAGAADAHLDAITDEDRAKIRAAFGDEAAAGRVLRFVISTPGRKDDGIRLAPGKWDFERFAINPRVFWQHERWSPRIADSVVWEEGDGTVRALAAFYSREVYPFSWQIGEMWALRGGASSIGVRILEWRDPDDGDPYAIDAVEQELLEWSLVNLPLDEGALMEARSAGIDTRPLAEALAEVLDQAGLRRDLERLWQAASPPRPHVVDMGGEPPPPVPSQEAAGANEPGTAQLPRVGQEELRAALRGLPGG